MGKLNVAIIGAGMSGLVFAIALQKLAPDVTYELYEGASTLSEVGAGISAQDRSWSIMQALGLEDLLLQVAGTDDHRSISVVYRKGDQPQGVEFNEEKFDSTDIRNTFHRGDLQKAFLEHLAQYKKVQTSKRLVSYTQPEAGTPGPITLHFKDGSTATCDLLVGADGVRSAVRSAMYSQSADAALAADDAMKAEKLRSLIQPRYSGNIIYRTLVDKDSLSEEVAAHPAFNRNAMMIYCGKNKQVVTYPIHHGRVINVAAVISHPDQEGSLYQGPWVSTSEAGEVVQSFKKWESDVQEILKHIGGPLKWVINVVQKLPTYVHGRVALMGDAAHAMTPHQGSGAGQGFEDAYLLALFLGRADVTKDNVHIALRVYDEVRRPYSQNVSELSRMSGKALQLSLPGLGNLTEEESATGEALTQEQLRQVGVTIHHLTDWRVASTVAQDNEAAFHKLDEALEL